MSALFPILLTVQIITCVAMIGVILLQRSEGGGLGMGGGGGVGGLMTGRGAANALTRTTVILATIFIVTSMALALVVKNTTSNNPLAPGSTPGGPSPSPLTTLPAGPAPTPQPAGPTAPAAPPAIPVPASPAPSTAPATPQPAPAAPPAQPSGGGTH